MKRTYEPPKVTKLGELKDARTRSDRLLAIEANMDRLEAELDAHDAPKSFDPDWLEKYPKLQKFMNEDLGAVPVSASDAVSEASDVLAAAPELVAIMDEHFLTFDNWVDDDNIGVGFGVGSDSGSGMDLITLAFRCSETDGASLLYGSTGIPKFHTSERVTHLECSEMRRYVLLVDRKVAKIFVDLLRKDLAEVATQIDLLRLSRSESLKVFLLKKVWAWAGQSLAYLLIAVVVALVGWQFLKLEPESAIALWGAMPVAAWMLLRASYGAVQSVSAFRKLMESDSE